ncbi:MAG: site-specific integrase [Gemmataceae bacterium]|nr:site-specific integrase [Gemmataceae bacterium]
MPARRKSVPSYLPHDNPATRARAVWTDPTTGRRRYVLLPGGYDSPESREAYRRLLAELDAVPNGRPEPPAAGPGLTVAEVLLAFMTHADRHYRGPDGRHTSEYAEYRLVARALRELYGHTPAAGFGPLALKAVRQVWVAAGLARTEVNRRANMARRVFRWAASEELVPAAVPAALGTVDGLKRGRTPARETEPVRPVDPAHVEATLPFLPRPAAGLIRFLRLVGCRPGEGCRVRPCDLDTSGPVWWYKPAAHKGAWRGKARAVAVGPRAQAVLAEFTPPDPTDHYFNPRRAAADLHARRTGARVTPRYPSHLARNAGKRAAAPRRAAGPAYTAGSLGRAVARAVGRANALRRVLAGAGDFDPVPGWAPNQLRHAHGTEVRKRFGLEAAQAALGHERADVTQVYAEKNLDLAARVAAEIG